MEEIAFFVGVSPRVLYNWSGKYKDFKEALIHSRAIADEMVEASLFHRAIGYTHKETKVFFDSKSMQTVEHEVDKHYPPDTAAAQFWLKNRDPEKWKDKTEVEHSGNIETLSDDELDRRIKALTEKPLNDEPQAED